MFNSKGKFIGTIPELEPLDFVRKFVVNSTKETIEFPCTKDRAILYNRLSIDQKAIWCDIIENLENYLEVTE